MSTKVRSVLKNSGIAFGILGIATAFCFLVQRISESDTHVPLLFVLAGLFVSRLCELRTEFPTVTEALRIINHNIGSRIKLH